MMTGNGAYIAFVDVSNAFSSVQIPLLLDALLKYGVCAQVRDLFSYVLYHSFNYVYSFGYQTGRRTGLVLWGKLSLSGKGLGQGFLNVAEIMVLVVFLDSIVF